MASGVDGWCCQPVDYDSLSNPFFNLTVYAQDLDPTHVDTAYVEIRVTDFNDNAPLFVPNSKKVCDILPSNKRLSQQTHKMTSYSSEAAVQFIRDLARDLNIIVCKIRSNVLL